MNMGLLRRSLLAWHRRHGRHHLPWRAPWDPYRVLVSEAMLQQTTVQTVIPYFHRFIKVFPSLQTLARAPQERVLKLWAGLGYYARARNLHAAAQKIVAEFGGRLPRTAAGALSLPGVGRYTAGALLSFARNAPAPLVDGNVVRVFSRLVAEPRDVRDQNVNEQFWTLARELVPPTGGRYVNSALMDLGALVCRPRAPVCPLCPWKKKCRAHALGREESFPVKGAKTRVLEMKLWAALVRKGGKLLLVRRPLKGLYGGLWEFPSGEGEVPSVDVLSRWAGGPVRAQRPLPMVQHALSHRRLKVTPWLCGAGGTARPVQGARWIPPGAVKRMAVSSLTRKLVKGAEG
jgi:A/G-specific adenine glycosylase